jgi:glycosyltransferase involved in cell wall biosynthesis
MRVGIFRSSTSSMSGGVFQYELVVLKGFGEIARGYSEELIYVSHNPTDLNMLAGTGGLSYRGLPILQLTKLVPQLRAPETFLGQPPQTPAPLDPNIINFDYGTRDALRAIDVDLLFLLSPTIQAYNFRLPFVFPIFDLNHRLQPEFPEVSAFGETNSREYFYINACRYATLVLVDSEVGKADVLEFYGGIIEEDRIRVLPYYPPIERRVVPNADELNRVRTKYDLPKRYFFYPAQFWPHKNHALILRAIKIIADETGEKIPVIFCGSYWTYTMAANFKELIGLASESGIAENVRYLGSVPDDDMAALYSLSAGLVMPTFFGPTNIPPLEAWHLGRPVITSDIRGIREHIGDASLLVDPRSPVALAQAMKRIWRDEALCAELVRKGRERLASYSWDSFIKGLSGILDEACERVKSGRTPQYPNDFAMQTVSRV